MKKILRKSNYNIGLTLLFLILSACPWFENMTNPRSRLATVAALIEDRSFSTNHYIKGGHFSWTIDWVKNTDGNYFSNKPPGPAILAYPFTWIVDRLFFLNSTYSRRERDQKRYEFNDYMDSYLSMILQVLPLIFMALLWKRRLLKDQQIPENAVHLLLVTLFFGTTASILARSFWGHTLTSVLVLLLLYCLESGWFFFSGLVFGLGCLCEYSMLFLFLPCLLWIPRFYKDCLHLRYLFRAVLGVSVPAGIFFLYHYKSFGNDFLPFQFVNPIFKSPSDTHHIFGIQTIMPDFNILIELLFGMRRGLLFSQPWVLLVFFITILKLVQRSKRKSNTEDNSFFRIEAFGTISLTILIFLNAGFNGWHGGGSPGPRYLAPILPVFALISSYQWANYSQTVKTIFIIGLFYSVVLFLSASICGPLASWSQPLPSFYFDQVLHVFSNRI